jgi:hypothetical protein
MKNTVAVFLAVLILAVAAPAFGANSIFQDEQSCNAALATKTFAYYIPVDVSKKNINPIDNITVFPVKLEADMCRYQYTMKGWKWVVQKGDTLMRARKNETGELVIFARNDCGNADNTPPVPSPVAPASPTPTTEEDRITQVIDNSFHIENPEYGRREYVPPPTLGFAVQDRFHGWCGFWTDLGCSALAGVIVGGTIYIATRGGDEKDPYDPNGGETGNPRSVAKITPRVGFVPPRGGHGGGAFIGASIHW